MRCNPIILLLFFTCQWCWSQQQPNIILINLDDVEENALNPTRTHTFFPNMARFHSQGMRFTNAHVTTPLCGPSRCCLFRAQYAHNTGIRNNDGRNVLNNGFAGGHRFYVEQGHDQDDLGTWMKGAGYRTMMVGKYLNNDVVNIIPVGWDDFRSSRSSHYYGTYRFGNADHPDGRFYQLPDDKNRTEAEAEDVIELINHQRSANPNQPFFVYWAPLASHSTSSELGMVEPRYSHYWPNLRVPRVASYNEADMSDKRGPMWMLPQLTPQIQDAIDVHFRERTLSLKTVDDMVGRLFETLEDLEIANQTYIVLTSDNGWLEGHHRMYGKSAPYDRATKVPLLVMGPGIPASTVDHLIAHIDIGPTIVEMASGITPTWVDGKSFRDVLFNPDISPQTWRKPILIETWSTINMIGLGQPIEIVSSALRYYDESYIEWFNGDAEYYHLPTDPHQIHNRFDQLSQPQQLKMAADIRAIKTPMEPEVGIVSPFGVDDIVGRQFNIRGFAEDDLGLWGVKAALIDQATNLYWNGSAWQSDFAQLSAEMTNPGGQLTKWQIPIDIPRELATENTIKLRVWPIDLSGNYRRDIESYFRFDLTPPVCTIEQPTRHQRLPQQVSINGSVVDDSEIDQIRLVIKDRDVGTYWNGEFMVDDWNYHTATILENDQWSFEAVLPPGRYFVSVRGIDEHGNYATDVVTQFFIVQ